MKKIYHIDEDELSAHNLEVIRAIEGAKDPSTLMELLAQAYIFLTTCRYNILNFKNLVFHCHWCKGCGADHEGCQSKYCLHGEDCPLAIFLEKLEKAVDNRGI